MISVRITGVVFDQYGRQLAVGSTQSLADDFGASVIAAGLGVATTSVLYPPASTPPFDAYPSGTLAQMLAIQPVAGLRFHTTDTYVVNGSVNAAGNDWIADGSVWRPRGPQRVLVDTTITTGAQQIAEQIIKTYTIPAGLLFMQRFTLEMTLAKSGSTDALNQMNMRLGPLGTTGDSFLGQTSTSIFTAAKRSAGYSCSYECTGTNTIIKHGTGGGIDNNSFTGMAGGTVVQTPFTLTGANLQTTAQLLTFAVAMTAATTDSPQIGGVFLTLTP